MSTFRRPASWAYKFTWQGKQILRSGWKTQAEASAAERQHRKLLSAGLVAEAERILRRRGGLTVGQILTDYAAAGYPDRDGQPRPPASRDAEARNVETLAAWWGSKIAEHLTNKDRDAYHAHRMASVSRGTGHRTTELELTTLRNALHFAVESSVLPKLPAIHAKRYRLKENVAHARDVMPRSGDEVHRLAAFLLGWKPSTQVYGWAVLLGALTGLRSGELRALRACPAWPDPLNPRPVGHWDQQFICVHREKQREESRRLGLIRLDDPERPDILPLLNTILAWKGANYPASQFLLPNTEGNDLETSSITKALQDAAAHLGLPERRAHGLRAYYATVRLAHRHTRGEVADELGQGSGDELVASIYGAVAGNFETDTLWRMADRLTWRPNTPGRRPAWDLLTQDQKVLICLPGA
jgi:integrase